jgi:lipopolysaccharide transport system ATP-binding protein
MSIPAVKVEGLWKEYVVGQARRPPDRLYDLLSHAMKAPLNRWRNLRGEVEASARFWALQDVNFELQQGEVLGVIGGNGAGKSTLLKTLSRITAPTRGRIAVHGRLASLLEVGTGFHPELSGRENIYLNGAILGMSRKEVSRKFDEIVQFAEVEKFIETPVKRYSSGMYVRLAFAVAAHLDTDVMVVDEVLAVGDISFQRRCLGSMQALASSGRSIVFVSHNLHAVRQLCTRALVLEAGRITAAGAPEEAISYYVAQAQEAESRLAWEPGDAVAAEGFCLRRVQLEGTDSKGRVRSDRPVRIRFSYSVGIATEYLRIGFDLKDKEGAFLFRSFEDDQPARCVPHEPGDFEAVAEIPGNLLNKGRHAVDIRIGVHRVKWLAHIDNALTFDVDNSGGLNSHYEDEKPGLFNPKIDWQRAAEKLAVTV